MIYFEGLESIIESIYLDDKIGNKIGECSVLINPEYTKYLSGKVIIINSQEYQPEKIKELVENGNKVVTRVSIFKDIQGVIFQPYIMRITYGIQYSGRVIPDADKYSFKDILQNFCNYDSGILCFPKLYNLPVNKLIDNSGNLTGIGWACQQVGINILEDTKFKNLDILKLKKLYLQ